MPAGALREPKLGPVSAPVQTLSSLPRGNLVQTGRNRVTSITEAGDSIDTSPAQFSTHRPVDQSSSLPWPVSSTQGRCPKKTQASPSHPHSQYQLKPQARDNTLSTRESNLLIYAPLLKSKRYTDNGGSTLGITGSDFAILAGDTRSTSGYSINSRFVPKVFRIGDDDSSCYPSLALLLMATHLKNDSMPLSRCTNTNMASR
jgi:hypothetical protein